MTAATVRATAQPRAAAAVGINDQGDWIASYSRTTFVGCRL